MSWQMTAVGWFMRVSRKRRFADPDGAVALLARPKADPAPPARVAARVDITTETVDGFAVCRVRRRGSGDPSGPMVVYLHGGAYVNEIAPQHWQFVADLVEHLDPALDAEVCVPLYGLAPQHVAREARALVAAVLARGRAAARPAYLIGDSSGGGLALVAAQAEVAAGYADLLGVCAIAPWLDLTMANPEVDEVEPTDPWLARAALHGVAAVWAGTESVDSAAISPMFGSLDALPPVDLWVGTRDVTWPDTRALAHRLREAGNEVGYHEAPGAIHVHPLLPVPEGRRAARAIRARIAGVLAAHVA